MNKHADYRCVTDLEEVQAYLRGANTVAFDYETAPDESYRDESKAALDPHKCHLVSCSFSTAEFSGITVPIAHKIGHNIDREGFIALLREFLSDARITKVAHNIAFESAISYHLGIIIMPPVYDTFCAAQMTLKTPFDFRDISDSGLKTLAPALCGEALPSFSDVTSGRHFDELDPQDTETIRYGAADSDFALRLMHIFNNWFDRQLPAHRRIVEEIESPTAVYLGIMKYNGIPLNMELMAAKEQEIDQQITELYNSILSMVGGINIGANCSTKAFRDFLYVTNNLPAFDGRKSTDDETLIRLKNWCDQNKPDLSPLFNMVQHYRKLAKLKSTYIDGYRNYLNPVTGCVHPELLSLSTETGRMCCRNPNTQNMPRKTNDPIGIRNFFCAPEGHLIVSCDFSQIELRVGAFYCRDPIMMQTYANGGDIHAATTCVIFGCSMEEALDKHNPDYKERRTIAKNVNFGTFYGLYARGLQRTLEFKAGIPKSIEQCETILQNLRAGYSQLTVWQKDAKKLARRNMYTEDYFGRRRYLPEINSQDWGRRSFAERCALNTPIQGTAADILKLAIVRVLQGLPERPWLKPVLQIHDELTFIIPQERLDEAVQFIRQCMEEKPFDRFDLPLIAEASYGKTFGNMEEM